MGTATQNRRDWRYSHAVQYRFWCEGGCGEVRMVAVIRRPGKRDLRICPDCYEDGFWRDKP